MKAEVHTEQNTPVYQTRAAFYLKKLKPLVGRKITGLVQDDTGNFGVTVEAGNNQSVQHLFFLRDDEGNGPGSFEIVQA